MPMTRLAAVSMVAVGLLSTDVRGEGLRLNVAQISQIPADREQKCPVRLRILNSGKTSAYLTPSISDLSGRLDIFVREVGSDAFPRQLFSVERPHSGFAFEDLFELKPGRELIQTIWGTCEPLFSGEGMVEIWAEYDASEMGNGDSRAFAGRLSSEHIRVPVMRRQSAE